MRGSCRVFWGHREFDRLTSLCRVKVASAGVVLGAVVLVGALTGCSGSTGRPSTIETASASGAPTGFPAPNSTTWSGTASCPQRFIDSEESSSTPFVLESPASGKGPVADPSLVRGIVPSCDFDVATKSPQHKRELIFIGIPTSFMTLLSARIVDDGFSRMSGSLEGVADEGDFMKDYKIVVLTYTPESDVTSPGILTVQG